MRQLARLCVVEGLFLVFLHFTHVVFVLVFKKLETSAGLTYHRHISDVMVLTFLAGFLFLFHHKYCRLPFDVLFFVFWLFSGRDFLDNVWVIHFGAIRCVVINLVQMCGDSGGGPSFCTDHERGSHQS